MYVLTTAYTYPCHFSKDLPHFHDFTVCPAPEVHIVLKVCQCEPQILSSYIVPIDRGRQHTSNRTVVPTQVAATTTTRPSAHSSFHPPRDKPTSKDNAELPSWVKGVEEYESFKQHETLSRQELATIHPNGSTSDHADTRLSCCFLGYHDHVRVHRVKRPMRFVDGLQQRP